MLYGDVAEAWRLAGKSRARLLETSQRGAARFPHAVGRLRLRTLVLRARRDHGELVGHGLRVALGRLEAHTDRVPRSTPKTTGVSTDSAPPRQIRPGVSTDSIAQPTVPPPSWSPSASACEPYREVN